MEPSSAVEDAYVDLIGAMSRGDVAAFMARISRQPGTLVIGTAPDEWAAGPAAIEQLAGRFLPATQRAGLTFHPGDPQAFSEVKIGWVADRLTVRASNGDAQELRVTAVFRDEDGRWKVVLYGHSLGVPDEEVEVFKSVSS